MRQIRVFSFNRLVRVSLCDFRAIIGANGTVAASATSRLEVERGV